MYLWRKIFGRALPLKEDPAFDIDEAATIAQPDPEASLTAEQMEEREKQDKELQEVCTHFFVFLFFLFFRFKPREPFICLPSSHWVQ